VNSPDPEWSVLIATLDNQAIGNVRMCCLRGVSIVVMSERIPFAQGK
jgi:hypothetical protein